MIKIITLLVLVAYSAQTQTNINLSSYGGVGDAITVSVNTFSNSVLVNTTNTLSIADAGKTIEIFSVGIQNYGVDSFGNTTNGNQDFIGIITNVINGTNVYVQPLVVLGIYTNVVPQANRTNAMATYGTDNTPVIRTAITSLSMWTNATIIFSSGSYLCMPTLQDNLTNYGYGYSSIPLQRGGLRFLGMGATNTIILGRGAFQDVPFQTFGAVVMRGFIFEICATLTNDYPIIIDSMTLDGGVKQGNLLNSTPVYPANTVDGLGWDSQHSAYLVFGGANGNGPTATHVIFTNLIIQHWRGEEIKSIDSSSNGNITITGCTIRDGNATALNMSQAWNVYSNIIDNVFDIAEFQQSYPTNYSIFSYNVCTNITGNGFSWDVGTPTAKNFLMGTNTFYFSGVGDNGLLPSTGINLNIIGNVLNCANYMTAIAIGQSGGVGNTLCNSNITITGNVINCSGTLSAFISYGGSGLGFVSGLTISSNVMNAADCQDLIVANTYATNVQIFGNNFGSSPAAINISTLGNGVYPLIQSNNYYTPYLQTYGTIQTNQIFYGSGPKQYMSLVESSNILILVDTNASQIPPGAFISIDNRTNQWVMYYGGSGSIIVQPSVTSTASIIVTTNQITTFFWNQLTYQWQTNPVTQSGSLGTYVSGIIAKRVIMR